jgi:hypothetical protein
MNHLKKIIFPLIPFIVCISGANASPSELLESDSVREIQEDTLTAFEEILAVKDDLRDLLIRSKLEEMPHTLTDHDVQLIEQKIEKALKYLRRACQSETISEKRLNVSMARLSVNTALAMMTSEIADFNQISGHSQRNY